MHIVSIDCYGSGPFDFIEQSLLLISSCARYMSRSITKIKLNKAEIAWQLNFEKRIANCFYSPENKTFTITLPIS